MSTEGEWEEVRAARIILSADERAKLDFLRLHGYVHRLEPVPDDDTRAMIFVQRGNVEQMLDAAYDEHERGRQ